METNGAVIVRDDREFCITLCKCGAEFAPWEFCITEGAEFAEPCPVCGRLYYVDMVLAEVDVIHA